MAHTAIELSIREKFEIEQQCNEANRAFAYYLDRGEFDRAFRHVVADATFIDRAGQELHGVDEISATLGQRRPPGLLTRHFLAVSHFVQVAPDFAKSTTLATVYYQREAAQGANRPPSSRLVEFDDEFVRTQGGWLIARRDANTIFEIRQEG